MSSAAGFPDDLAESFGDRGAVAPARRVREEVRDGALLMAFSAAVSCSVAAGLVVLSRILG